VKLVVDLDIVTKDPQAVASTGPKQRADITPVSEHYQRAGRTTADVIPRRLDATPVRNRTPSIRFTSPYSAHRSSNRDPKRICLLGMPNIAVRNQAAKYKKAITTARMSSPKRDAIIRALDYRRLTMTKIEITPEVVQQIKSTTGPIVLIDSKGQTIGSLKRGPSSDEIMRAQSRVSNGAATLTWDELMQKVKQETGK